MRSGKSSWRRSTSDRVGSARHERVHFAAAGQVAAGASVREDRRRGDSLGRSARRSRCRVRRLSGARSADGTSRLTADDRATPSVRSRGTCILREQASQKNDPGLLRFVPCDQVVAAGRRFLRRLQSRRANANSRRSRVSPEGAVMLASGRRLLRWASGGQGVCCDPAAGASSKQLRRA